jgi:hypothetical protein
MSETTEDFTSAPKAGQPVAHDTIRPPSLRSDGVHVVKKVHADGEIDFIDAHAIGGDLDEMPPGYYTSASFIFTFIVRIMKPNCLMSLVDTHTGHLPRFDMRVSWLGFASEHSVRVDGFSCCTNKR